MVHHPQLVYTGGFGGSSNHTQVLAEPLAPAGPIEARQMQTDPDALGRPPPRIIGDRGVDLPSAPARQGGGNYDRWRRSVHLVPRFRSHLIAYHRPAAELVGNDVSGNGHRPGAVAPPTLGGRGVEHDRGARHACRMGGVPPPGPQLGVETEGVDHGGQSTPQPAGHDLFEHGERIR